MQDNENVQVYLYNTFFKIVLSLVFDNFVHIHSVTPTTPSFTTSYLLLCLSTIPPSYKLFSYFMSFCFVLLPTEFNQDLCNHGFEAMH